MAGKVLLMTKWVWTKRNRACPTYSYCMDNLADAQNSHNSVIFFSELNLQQLNFEVGRYRANLPPSTSVMFCKFEIKWVVREDGRKIVIKKAIKLFLFHILALAEEETYLKNKKALNPTKWANKSTPWVEIQPPFIHLLHHLLLSLEQYNLPTEMNSLTISSLSNWNAVICSDFMPNIWLFQSFLGFNCV